MKQYIKLQLDPLGSAAGTGMGLLLGAFNDRRQINQQRALNEQQYSIDNRMAEANYERQIRMWNDTNYSAQVAQMKKAGLNPALLYGKGGQGGVLGNPAGSVNAKAAPQGGMEISNMMLMKAQMELIEAQTQKTKVEATKIGGVDTAEANQRIETAKQQINNAKAQESLTKVQTALAEIQQAYDSATLESRTELIDKALEKVEAEINSINTQTDINQATKEHTVNLIKGQAANEIVKGSLMRAQTQNTKQSTEESKQRVKNMQEEINKWTAEISQKWSGLHNEQQRIDVEKFMKRLEVEQGYMFNNGVRYHYSKEIQQALKQLFVIPAR